MNSQKISNVLTLSPEERYFYFIEKIADTKVVWGLYDEGWAACASKSGQEALPLWPEAEFAQQCLALNWAKMKPRSIEIQDFIDKWLPGLNRDDRMIAVFPTPSMQGLFVSTEQLDRDLKVALQEYE